VNRDETDPEIFKKGYCVGTLDACMVRAERFAQAVAKLSGQKVDWYYSGGIASVLYIGDYEKVAAAFRELKPALEAPMAIDPKDGSCRCGIGPSGHPSKAMMHDDCRVLSTFGPGAHGPYRAGDELPGGVIGVDTH
jgi:hypothetical protein